MFFAHLTAETFADSSFIGGIPGTPGAVDLDFIKPRVLLAIAIILIVARLVGALFRKIGQPPVVGEMLAGVLLGPSILGQAGSEFIFPLEIRPFLKIIAELGLVIFMFVVGLELDPRLIRGRERIAAIVSTSSVVVAFLMGCGLATALYAGHSIVNGLTVPKVPFVLFIGASMSVTAFPVLARILADRDMFRTPLGAMALACAAVDDILAWSLLAVVVAIANSSGMGGVGVIGDAGSTIVLSIAFCALMFFVVKPLLKRLVSMRASHAQFPPVILTVVLIGILLSSWATEAIGIHTIFGAFIFGAIMPREESQELFDELLVRIEHLGVSLLLPVFFVVTGMGVDLRGLGISGLTTLLAVLFVACAGKFFGTSLPARAVGMKPRRAAALGILMNTRGLTELVILSVGRDQGFLDDQLFTMLVIMAIFTTVITGPLLARVYPSHLMKMDQTAAENLHNLRGFHLLIASTTPTSLLRISRIGALLTANERPSAMSISAVVRQQPSELGAGIPTDFIDLAQGMSTIRSYETELRRHGVTTALTTNMSQDPVDEMRGQAARIDPNLIVVEIDSADWVEDFAEATDAPMVFVTGTWPRSFGPMPASVRLELHQDTPLAVEVAARLAISLDTSIEIVDATGGGQRRRVSSFRDRLAGAGISAFQPDPERDAPPPSITVIDISGSYPRFDGCDAPTIFVRGLTDDQGDLFQTWLQRRRATMSAADAEIEVPKDDPGAGQATTG